jgi:hypothetical protein
MTEISRKISTFAVLAVAALALGACETDGSSPGPVASMSKPVAEPDKPAVPMTRSQAASECWMSTEKGPLRSNLDKRADAVDKCIADKMKSVAAAPKT